MVWPFGCVCVCKSIEAGSHAIKKPILSSILYHRLVNTILLNYISLSRRVNNTVSKYLS